MSIGTKLATKAVRRSSDKGAKGFNCDQRRGEEQGSSTPEAGEEMYARPGASQVPSAQEAAEPARTKTGEELALRPHQHAFHCQILLSVQVGAGLCSRTGEEGPES